MKARIKSFISVLLLSVSGLAGCIQTDEVNFPKRVDILFEVENMSQALTAGEDTLLIENFKFLADKFTIVAKDSLLLEPRVNSLIFSYNGVQSEPSLILGVDLGFEDIDTFIGYSLYISRATANDLVKDPDFYVDEEYASVIIKGTMNNVPFTFSTGIQFQRNFTFPPVLLSDDEETLVIHTSFDAQEIFIDENNQILNPRDNKSTIDSLIINALEVNARAAGRY